MTLDGGSPGQAPCETAEPPEPQMGYVLDGRSPPGPHTLHLWLARTDGTAVVTAPAAVLAAGVYRLPDPVAVVAGVPVYDRERVFDPSMDVMQEWQYVGVTASPSPVTDDYSRPTEGTRGCWRNWLHPYCHPTR